MKPPIIPTIYWCTGLFLTLSSLPLLGQKTCSEATPYYALDLRGNPDSLYLSPPDVREGSCCGTTFPDRCIEFNITLDQQAIGLVFDIYSGAEPPGALFYQIDCGQEVMVGEEVCLEGGRTYTLTFCKPGSNQNIYSIQSTGANVQADTVITRIDCSIEMGVQGLIDSTIVWRDISSGDGRYNAYLSCNAGCDTTIVTPDADAPSVILYEVCGMVAPRNCGPQSAVLLCDTVLVHIIPPLQIELRSDREVVFCTNDLQTLQASTNLPEEDIAYYWYVDGNDTLLGTGPLYAPASPGDYLVVAIDSLSAVCNTDTARISVSFQAAPHFSFSGDTIKCPGSPGNITLTPGYTYTWTPSSTVQTIPGSSTFQVDPDSSSTYLVTARDSLGCTESQAILVTVAPPFSIGPLSQQIDFCIDDQDSIRLMTNVPGEQVSFTWFAEQQATPVHTGAVFRPDSPGTYLAIATSLSQDVCNQDTVILDIAIHPLPDFNLPAQQTICANEALPLTLPEDYQYAWTPDTSVAVQGPGSFLLMPEISTSYLVSATSTAGCTNTWPLDLRVLPGPVVEAGTASSLNCTQNSVTLSGLVSNLSTEVGLIWSSPLGSPITNASTLTPSVTQPGWYYLLVFDEATGCTNLDSVLVTAHFEQPTAILPDSLSLDCSSDMVRIDGTSSSHGPGLTYSWTGPDGPINTPASEAVLTVNQSGRFTLSVTDTLSGCTDSDETWVVRPVPIDGIAYISNPVCWGTDTGRIILENIIGGTAPFRITLNEQLAVGPPEFTRLTAGSYRLNIQDTYGCQWTETINIDQHIPSQIQVDLYPVVRLGDTITLNVQTNLVDEQIARVRWSPATYLSCSDCLTPQVAPTESIDYALAITDIYGCKAEQLIQLRVDQRRLFYVPNAFSPNGDGSNDRFTLYANDAIDQIEVLRIFDRWGNQVFSAYDFPANDPQYGWDGTHQGQQLNAAVFVFYAQLRLKNGRTLEEKGEVLLLR